MNKLYILLILTMFLLPISVYSTISNTDNDLMFYWKFDDAQSPITDSKDNGHPDVTLSCQGVDYQRPTLDPHTSYSINFTDASTSKCWNDTAFNDIFSTINQNDWTVVGWWITPVPVGEARVVSTGVPADHSFEFIQRQDPQYALNIDFGAVQQEAVTGDAKYDKILMAVGVANSTGYYLLNGTELLNPLLDTSSMVFNTDGIIFGSDRNGNSHVATNTRISMFAIFNRSLTTAEIVDLKDNGIQEGPPPVATADPTWYTPPEDTWKNSTNITMSVNHTSSEVSYQIYLDDIVYMRNVSQTANFYLQFPTNLSDGVHTFKASVQNTTSGVPSNNVTRIWTLDSATPSITLYPNNAFNTSGVSSINQYEDYLFLNLSFVDESELFGYVINITDDNGVSYFNFTNTTLPASATTDNYSINISTASWPNGVYDVNISVSDTHTANSIDDYDVSKFLDEITFNTAEGNKIRIMGSGAYSTKHTKKIDRYEFGFDYLLKSDTRKFILKSDNKIYYLPDSKYKGHFVILSKGVGGNWIDFENIGSDYSVVKKSDYEYEITFNNLPLSNEIITKSLGGVNVLTETYKWYKGNDTRTFPSSPSHGETGIFVLNLTTDAAYVTPKTNFNYNGEFQTVVTTTGLGYTAFTSTLTIPDVSGSSQTINFYWSGNVSQSGGHQYEFNFTNSHTVENFIIYNCTGTTPGIRSLNVSLLNETDNQPIIGTMNYLFEYNLSGTTKNFSTSVLRNNMTFCIFPNSTTLTTDILIDYSHGGFNYEYALSDYVMTNVTQLLNIYTQDGTSRVTYTVTDLFDDPIEEAFIKILKYDVGTNTYKTMEILKTNSDGEAVGNIVLFTTFYQYIVDFDGRTFVITEPEKVFSTTKVFRLDLSEDEWFGNYDTRIGVTTKLNYTVGTNNFAYTWTDPTSAMHYGCLQVVKLNRTKEVTVCHSCTLSPAATILCNIGADPKGTYIAQGYLKFDQPMMTDILEKILGIEDFEGIWEKGPEKKEFGLFISLILITALTFIGLVISATAAIILTLLGFFIVSTLGFINLQVSAFITLVILGIIVIYRISRR